MKNSLKGIFLLSISLAVKPLHCEDPENLTKTLATLNLDESMQGEKPESKSTSHSLADLCKAGVCLSCEPATIASVFTTMCQTGLLNQALFLANTLDDLDKKDVAEKFLELNKSTLRLLKKSTEKPFKSARSITGYITENSNLYDQLYFMLRAGKTTNASISPDGRYLCTTTPNGYGYGESMNIYHLESNQLLCSLNTPKPILRACFYDDKTVLTLHWGDDIQAWSFQYSLEDMMQQVATQAKKALQLS